MEKLFYLKSQQGADLEQQISFIQRQGGHKDWIFKCELSLRYVWLGQLISWIILVILM